MKTKLIQAEIKENSMKCGACNRIKVSVQSFGGSLLCSSCMNIYNPKTEVLKPLSEESIIRKEKRINELKAEILKLEIELRNNTRLFKHNDQKYVTVIKDLWNY